MATSNTTATTTIEIPSILTANTFYWSPSNIASGRRRNEEKRQEEVSNFFKALGFEVQLSSDRVIANLPSKKLEVIFEYSETCGHVYKSLSVYRDGKKSNITAIKKLLV